LLTETPTAALLILQMPIISMIAKEQQANDNSGNPALTGAKNTTLKKILACMSAAVAPFKEACRQPNLRQPLNENKMTQIFVEQVEVQLKSVANIGVKNQYADIFFGAKGIPDFYFHKVEEGRTHSPLFVVEAKCLPAPGNVAERRREYVIGRNSNGGIQRFKTEMHGRGLDHCGMVGFVKNETFQHWQTNINHWVTELSQSDEFWQEDEILNEAEAAIDFTVLESTAYTTSQRCVHLHHLWIYTQ
jgi:hypothetical protein